MLVCVTSGAIWGVVCLGHAVIWSQMQRTDSEVFSYSRQNPIISVLLIQGLNQSIRLTKVCQKQHIYTSFSLCNTLHTHMRSATEGKFRTIWDSNQLDTPTSHTYTRTVPTPWVHQCEPSTFRPKPTLLYLPTVGTVSHAGLDSSTSPPCPRLHMCVGGCA